MKKINTRTIAILAFLTTALSGCGTKYNVQTGVQASKEKPVVALGIAPVSRTVSHSYDFTPGLAGLIQNVGHIVKETGERFSDEYRVYYLYPQDTLLTGKYCAKRSEKVAFSEYLKKIQPGEYIVFKKDKDDKIQVERIASKDPKNSMVVESDFCYAKYKKMLTEAKQEKHENANGKDDELTPAETKE